MEKTMGLDAKVLHDRASALFAEERARKRLDGWFLGAEIEKECDALWKADAPALRAAKTLREKARRLPLDLSDHAVFAGTQRDAFARSYALINPTFKVNSFTGYCDPTAVFQDIEPSAELSSERIGKLRDYVRATPFVKALAAVYEPVEASTHEAVFFIEQVTGHLIPDFRPVLAEGLDVLAARIAQRRDAEKDGGRKAYYEAMGVSLEAVRILAARYADLARAKLAEASGADADALRRLADALERVPAAGARNLFEAVQSYLLCWQAMCLEQSPNPFAFSVGNADRIFEPYRAKENLGRAETAGLFKHFLVFFNVGDRSWAISQNILLGGKGTDGGDLANPSTYALLDAYFEMNLPQPILSVKLHRGTPAAFYESLGRFFFTPGVLTPSLFNDDSLFGMLSAAGVAEEDLADYSVAGCQEPLIMGKDNGNTTNSWLNLAKVLELTLNDGKSLISGEKLGLSWKELGYAGIAEAWADLRNAFRKQLEKQVDTMVHAANGATKAIALKPVPFLSTAMGGVESGVDARDVEAQGTRYNGSGCLIHGLSVVADSFIALDNYLKERPGMEEALLEALRSDYAGASSLRQYLQSCPKFGNNQQGPDAEAASLAESVSALVSSRKNCLGNPFRPDYATPSTHLLYGYWTGASPDGRKAREMLGYGVDPLYGEARLGLGFRVLSNAKLPFAAMRGGYASHFGLDPRHFRGGSDEERGLEFRDKVIKPLFFAGAKKGGEPFYLYVNVTTPETLRKVLADPKKYAPSGVYIMRIHGTFVNFLDLSPEIQQDIIMRLDPASTKLAAGD